MTCGSLRGRVRGCFGGNVIKGLGLFGDSVLRCGSMESGHSGVLPRYHPRHPALGCGIHNAYLLGLAVSFPGFRIECGMTCGSLRGRVRGCLGWNVIKGLGLFGNSVLQCGSM